MRQRFAAVIGNWWTDHAASRSSSAGSPRSTASSRSSSPASSSSPRFFSGAIPLGGIFQTASAFGQVQGALSWFINAYASFAIWKATVDRLIGFTAALEQVRAEADAARRRARRGRARRGCRSRTCRSALPQGTAAACGRLTLELKPGEDVLVTGPSGSGKSTLFRALAGIWPYWKGRIRLPKGARLLFLPQKPYLPIGTLKHAVSYPDDAAAFRTRRCAAALDAVGLGPSRGQPGAQRELGAGALGRRAAAPRVRARAARTSPTGCSSTRRPRRCPRRTRTALYRLLKERLPGTTLVSIGHRASLARASPQRPGLAVRRAPAAGARAAVTLTKRCRCWWRARRACPTASSSRASAVATRLPAWITLPMARSRPVSDVIARTRLVLASSVV